MMTGGLVTLVLVALVFVLLYLSFVQDRVRMLEVRIQRMSAMLQRVAARTGMPESPLDRELRQLIAAGQRIEAIRTVKEQLGLRLKDAKEYVDSL